MTTRNRGGGPAAATPSRSERHHAADHGERTALSDRALQFKACADTWAHLARRGLTSETVRDTLQEILRSAA